MAIVSTAGGARARTRTDVAPPRAEAPASRGHRRKLADRVANEIEAEVIRLGWPVGRLLGSEASLSERFGVGRTTLREAVRLVEAHQVAQMRRGSRGGLVVIAPPQMSAVQASALVFLDWANVHQDDLFEIRSTLERAGIRQLIDRMDDTLARQLRRVLDDEDERFATYGLHAETPDIHVQLARLTGNPAVWLFVDVLTGLLHNRAHRRLPDDEATAQRLHLTHIGIIDAIIERDVGLAQHRMDRHLRAVASLLR